MRAVLVLACLATSSLAMLGCRAHVDDGRFTCVSGGCPVGFTCIAGRCREGTDLDAALGELDAAAMDAAAMDASSDGGGSLDATLWDAGSDAAAPDAFSSVDARALSDAARDGGPDAARDAGLVHPVRVLDALADDGGVPLTRIGLTLAGEHREVGPGCVTRFASVPDGVQTLAIEVAGTTVSADVLVEEPTLVVVGRSESGEIATFARRDDLPAAGAMGESVVQYLPLVRTSAGAISLLHGVGGSRAAVGFGAWTDTHTSAEPNADVALFYTETFVIPRLLASFRVAVPPAARVVLTGNADAHPSSPDGPRAILVPSGADECGAPILPDPQIVAANLAQDRLAWFGSPAYVCQLGSGVDAFSVAAGDVTGTASSFAGLSRFGIARAAADACGRSARVVDLGTFAHPGGRYLAVFSGVLRDTDVTDWTITLLEDPPPEIPSAAGGPTSARVLYASFAPMALASPFDVFAGTSTTERLANDVAVAMPVAGTTSRDVIGTIGFRLAAADAPTTTLEAYPAPSLRDVGPGSAFVLVSDVNNLGVEARIDYVAAPYGRPFRIQTLSPMP
ncbi:MAG: hypothetical protein K1X94_09310 [Sandaracinaceae bacterium]|nr:hypothetical protein [Sandaracinaceae bacterium]